MLVPQRNFPNNTTTNDGYRYGFQGQEKDDEIKKTKGTSLNYKFRMHDPRGGRFFTVDLLTAKYPWNSSYAFSENRVVDGVELEGKEVLLVGLQNTGSAVVTGTLEAGMIIKFTEDYAIEDMFMYKTGSFGVETNLSFGIEHVSVTFFPNMKSAHEALGWGDSLGISGGELFSGSINYVTSGDFDGINVTGGFGGGLLPLAGSYTKSYTWAVYEDDEQRKKFENRILKYGILPTITRLTDELNNLNEKKDQLVKNISTMEKAISIPTSPENSDTLNSVLDSYRNSLNEVNKSIESIESVLKPLKETLENIDNEE